MQDVPKTLILKASAGDTDAFEELYRKTSSYVYTIAYRVAMNKEDAEEITQDVFISLHKNLWKFAFKSTFKTWLYRITVNSAVNAYRKRKKEKEKKEMFRAEKDLFSSIPGGEAAIEAREAKEQVNKMLGALSEDQRAVIVLREIEGLSYEEIAKTIKIKTNTVRTRIKRARERLVFLFGRGGDHEVC